MPSTNFGDNSTVVGEPPYKRNGEAYSKQYPTKVQTSSQGFTGTKAGVSEFTTVDYTIEERPFFIPIGKDGVISALEKLNKQLVEVIYWSLYAQPKFIILCHCSLAGQGCYPRRNQLTGWVEKLYLANLVSLTMGQFLLSKQLSLMQTYIL